MKVILQQDIRGKGKRGQMIEVSDGYARNYMLPRKLAVEATADNVNTMRMNDKAMQEKRQRDTKKRAFPPSQPKKTENRRKSAQKPNPNRGERRNLRQVNARQIGAGEHSQPTANRKQNHAPAFVHQPCPALLWYDGHKMPVSLLT